MKENSMEFNSIAMITMNFLKQTLPSLSSHPLFSSIITLYTLILLYFPTLFLKIFFSPIFISTQILFFTLLRLGAIQKTQQENERKKECDVLVQETLALRHKQKVDACSLNDDQIWATCKTGPKPEPETGLDSGYDPTSFYMNSFVEWDVRAPLEVIYEGAEDEIDDVFEEKRETQLMGIEKYASLSLYYPETDSDSSSEFDFSVVGDWDLPDNMCFRWGEEGREGLIEIALDGKRENEEFLHGEEESLIEIDIFPTRNDQFPGDKW